MPDKMSQEKVRLLKAFGAEVIITPTAVPPDHPDNYVMMAKRIAEETPNAILANQYHNPANPEGHYLSTGPEIWEQTGGRVGAFVDAQGTGGTLTGVTRFLKEQDPAIQAFAVEPEECPILAGGGWGPHRIEGIGDGFIPDNLHLDLLDGVVEVSSDEAIAMARRLAREEGIFCGISSGCNVAGALKLARSRPELRRIVTIVSDNGLRYLSTELCGAEKPLEIPEREHPTSEVDAAKLRRHSLAVIH
jgi:cysteine synthase